MRKFVLPYKIPSLPPVSSHLALLFLGLFSASLFTKPKLDAANLPQHKWIYVLDPPPQPKPGQTLVPAININRKLCRVGGAKYFAIGGKHFLEFRHIYRSQLEQMKNIVWSDKHKIQNNCKKIKKIVYGAR